MEEKIKFVHLHNHNEYSLLDGVGTAEDHVKVAKELGYKHLGLTNHGNIDGCIKFQQACEAEDIKPIIGCEAYIVQDLSIKEKGEKRNHITLLCKNQTGWKNLMKMLTVANVDGFYYKPRIDVDLLCERSEGIIILSGCTSSVLRNDWGSKLMVNLNECIADDLYFEIMAHQLEEQLFVNKKAKFLAEQFGSKLVATQDVHYPNAEDVILQEVLFCIQSKKKITDESRWKFDIDDLYIKSQMEMLRAFKKQKQFGKEEVLTAMAVSLEIAEKCEGFRINQIPVDLPKVPGYEDRDETELMKEVVRDGFKSRITSKKTNAAPLPEYKARLTEEFNLICELGFQRYFLIVWELIDWCKNNDIMTGPGRGSVGGSLVAYCMGITDVDPIKYGLIFSRFISPARIDLPDIDMDFEDRKRDQVKAHLEECYGADNVAGLTTFMKMKGKSSLRDVARVYNVPYPDIDAAAKAIVERSGGDSRADFTIEDAFETFEDGIKFKKEYPEVSEISMKLEGQTRGVGQHAAAVCISKESLKDGERCNLCKRSGKIIANWDKYDSEYMGMMKLDVLGLSALTVLSETRRMVKENHGADIVFDDIPLDDEKVYKQISLGKTVGAFQIGSLGLQKFCRELGIDCFNDIVLATSLWRPGTLRSGMTSEFQLRKEGHTKWDYIHPAMEEITKETFGIILFQEQVMKFMYEFAGLPWKTCDTVRKVISKSQGDELFEKFRGLFVEGCKKKGTLDEKTAAKLWGELSSFGSYGFNKSHAVEYSLITYWDMWCKVNYPTEFFACSLTYGSQDKTEEYIEEARSLGMAIKLPKIGLSDPYKWMTKKGEENIYAPFTCIKGIGDRAAKAIQEQSDKTSSEGFFKTEDKVKGINKTVMSSLEKIKAFDIDADLEKEEVEEVNHLFSFDISGDPMNKIRGIYELLKSKGLISSVDTIDFSKPSEKKSVYIGMIPEVKFGYRKNMLKMKKEQGGAVSSAGMKGSMGGVYGFFGDETDHTMLVFDEKIYKKKKAGIEHCGGEWIMVEASHPTGNTNIVVSNMSTESELLSGDFDWLGANLLARNNGFELDGLSSCESCSLIKECTEPVLPSKGKYNVMVLGEAPGKDEDRLKEGFVGKSGNLLWDIADQHDIKREKVYVTNVVKCFPKESKTPNKRQISKCSSLWLEKEIENLKPIIILAMGNTCMQFFKNQSSGIMSMNGKTEWNAKYNSYICWSIHPASSLYSPENKSLLQEGIENFSKTLKNLVKQK